MARRLLLLLATGLFLPSCGGSLPTLPTPSGSAASTNCTIAGQCTFVRDTLQQYYYWYRELPNPDPASFASPEAYLEAVRYRAFDSSFSYVTSKAASDSLLSDSQYIGFGFSTMQSGDLELRISQVYPGSSATDAGLDRGDFLSSIGGRTVADLIRTGELANALGPTQVGFAAELTWRTRQGQERRATLAKRLVTIPTVPQTGLFSSGSARIGYIHFRSFVQPSIEALNTAFQQLRDAGATDLVLDLRYNGGGLVSVAQHLGDLIGGEALVGRVFFQYVHSDKQSSRNEARRFEAKPQAFGATRLVVITTRSSASASELVINGLRPYMDVKVVGDRTFGKPVGQYGFDFCDKVLWAVSFLVTNARGDADYFGGIPADCAAPDDVDHALASPQEASLAEALYVVRNGRCSGQAAAVSVQQASARERLREIPTDGWRQTLNAW